MATDNNIIKQKIDSVDAFPNGYSPNLDNKWEIVKVALERNNKNKVHNSYWVKLSAAAAIILMMGAYLYLSINRTPNLESNTISTKVSPSLIRVNTAQTKKNTRQATGVKSKNSLPLFAPPQTKITQVASETTFIKQQHQIIEEPEELIATQTTPIEQPRYVEIDFYNPALSPQTPTETIVKANQFKFKIHIGDNKQYLNVQNSSSNTIGLHATF